MRELSISSDSSSGHRDFDFLRGRWRVRNSKLQNPLDPDAAEWREFTTDVESRELLGGLGNLDTYRSDEFPGYDSWEAMALRLFEPDEAVWRIWWASTASPGELDNPVVGSFDHGHGVFQCDDVLGGRPVKVRYEWMTEGAQPLWKQSFSFDAGDTWRENWLMEWFRT